MSSPETTRALSKLASKCSGLQLDHNAVMQSALRQHLQRAAEDESLQNELNEFMKNIDDAMLLHRVVSDISAQQKQKLKVTLTDDIVTDIRRRLADDFDLASPAHSPRSSGPRQPAPEGHQQQHGFASYPAASCRGPRGEGRGDEGREDPP